MGDIDDIGVFIDIGIIGVIGILVGIGLIGVVVDIVNVSLGQHTDFLGDCDPACVLAPEECTDSFGRHAATRLRLGEANVDSRYAVYTI